MSAFNLGFGLLNTSIASNSVFGVQQANEARLGLANQMTPNMTPAQIAFTGNIDKALTLQGEAAKIQFAASQAMGEANRSMMKKYWEKRQQNIQNGYIFA